ncbi:MAG: HPr family phosphocarrier protein, partial [Elusimicrobiales bacterium]|nr:HPr family phosphocarrier protein [Elusimicrobiales bacterium]
SFCFFLHKDKTDGFFSPADSIAPYFDFGHAGFRQICRQRLAASDSGFGFIHCGIGFFCLRLAALLILAMIQKQIKVINELGIHARPAGLIVNMAATFRKCELLLENEEGMEVNAKSIMGVMMLAAAYGSTLILTAKGEDEEKAVAAIEKLFADKFDED